MEWLDEILNNTELTDKKDAICKELAKHFVPKHVFNEQSEKLKDKTTELETVNSKFEETVNNLPKVESEREELKTKLEQIKTDFENFKTETDNRVLILKKRQAVEKGLRDARANPDTIDLLLDKFNYDEIELDGDKISNFDKLIEPMRSERKSLFGEIKISGTDITKGVNAPTTTYRTKYDEALRNGKTLDAIKIKQEAFKQGEYI